MYSRLSSVCVTRCGKRKNAALVVLITQMGKIMKIGSLLRSVFFLSIERVSMTKAYSLKYFLFHAIVKYVGIVRIPRDLSYAAAVNTEGYSVPKWKSIFRHNLRK